MRALVTGGAGFIGSNLVDALVARGDDVVVLDDLSSGKRSNVNPAARFVEGSILTDALDGGDARCGDLLPPRGPGRRAHLGGAARVRRPGQRPRDGAGARRRRRRARRLQLDRRGDLRRVPAARARGRPAAAAQPLRHRQARRRGVPVRLEPDARDAAHRPSLRERLRPPPGGRARGRGRRDLPERDGGGRGRPWIYGDGQQTRDFVHVDDVVRALLAAVGRGGAFNVGSGVETPILELHEQCSAVTGDVREPSFGAGARGRRPAQRPRRLARSSASSAGGSRSRSTTGCAGPGTG